jgi:hypothetical protein
VSQTVTRTSAAVCEACGGEFWCGAALGGCWCAEVSLGEAARASLRGRFGGCLCRPCLEGFAAREASGGGEHAPRGTSAPPLT